MPTMNDVLSVIMGGGRGTRLYPLTKLRAKPAVPIAGEYRLIDIPLSNCINSDISRIAVLTQFNTVSLHRHITQTYNFDSFHRGWVHIWAAEQTFQSESWYQGTADAVRKQLSQIQSARTDYVLILAGDHLYRMDYEEMARFHWENDADITVAVQPVPKDQAFRFGLLKRTGEGRIVDFIEKPKDPDILENFVSRDDPEMPFLGSMGIYFFKTKVLIDLLENSTDTDFGGDVIPAAMKTHNVYGYNFDGYWEDIGTIRSFYETNLMLAQPESPFSFYDASHPIYTRPRFLPGTIVDGARLTNVLLSEGSLIGQAEIENSVIGLRSQVKDGVEIRNTVLMGADYFDRPEALEKEGGGIPIGIGENSKIDGAIIDKNPRIGKDVVILPYPRGTEIETDNWSVVDGVVVIPKNVVIPDGSYIGP